jgi:hypothetical protein
MKTRIYSSWVLVAVLVLVVLLDLTLANLNQLAVFIGCEPEKLAFFKNCPLPSIITSTGNYGRSFPVTGCDGIHAVNTRRILSEHCGKHIVKEVPVQTCPKHPTPFQ